jgi:microcystin-dependent protein
MAYVVKNTRGQTVATVLTGTTNTTATDLTLIGQNVVEYGLDQNENFVYVLENFANTTPPLQPLQGQIWFNTDSNTLTFRDISNTWTALASQSYVQAQKISPAFTGVPTAPTAATGTATTQIASTAFVANAVGNINLTPYAQLAGASFTGNVAGPTAPQGTNTTQLATTQFVQTTFANTTASLYVTIQDGYMLGNATAPTVGNIQDSSNLIATTAWVQNMYNDVNYSKYVAKINGEMFGIPTAPTAANATNSTQIATTAFVQNLVGNIDLSPYATKNNAVLTGVPTAPTASSVTSSNQLATTQFVQLQKISPDFTGTPTAPTATTGTNTTQIATTAFVKTAVDAVANNTVTELAGSMKMWPSATPPANWALCNGQAVSRTTYATLFAKIGTAYGSGDGSTTFNLPDFRDRMPMGAGSAYNAGSTGGYADAAVISHTHPVSSSVTMNDPGHSHNNVLQATSDNVQRRVTLNRAIGPSGTDAIGSNYGRNTDNATTGISASVNVSLSAPAGSVSGTGRNLPPYLGAYWIIKLSDDGSGGGTLQAGAGIDITTAGAYSTITNTGVKTLTAGTGISVTGANGNLTITNTGSAPTLVAGTGINITQVGQTYTFTNTVSAIPVIAGVGTTVTNTPGGAIVNANVASLQAGTGITVSNDSGTWTINAPGSGSASLGTSGWQEFPSGLIMQWGVGTISNTNSTTLVTFPRAFPNNLWNVQLTFRQTGAGASGILTTNPSTLGLSNMTVYRISTLNTTAITFWWQALGN